MHFVLRISCRFQGIASIIAVIPKSSSGERADSFKLLLVINQFSSAIKSAFPIIPLLTRCLL